MRFFLSLPFSVMCEVVQEWIEYEDVVYLSCIPGSLRLKPVISGSVQLLRKIVESKDYFCRSEAQWLKKWFDVKLKVFHEVVDDYYFASLES